ncbi:hypothetical protein PsorP6_010056 [Peronosclerospora sorghi]|uniref:Uncharacterized protein n=1 Tax=Peronosclerospora sorghi TaxID=230839 RepID=A0ACC0VVJ8_9STRA|nr:hypothetical protein PsorP6_010056 [Peronosclerospora sorghi]
MTFSRVKIFVTTEIKALSQPFLFSHKIKSASTSVTLLDRVLACSDVSKRKARATRISKDIQSTAADNDSLALAQIFSSLSASGRRCFFLCRAVALMSSITRRFFTTVAVCMLP